TAGYCRILRDGVEVLYFQGDTIGSTYNALGIRSVRFGAGSGSSQLIGGGDPNCMVTDIYVLDGTDATATQGAPFNDFLGDHKVETLIPVGNGANSDLLGSDGNSVDNYLLVDELPADYADYVTTNVIGATDTYQFSDMLSATGVIKGVQIKGQGLKTDSGVAAMALVTQLGANEIESPRRPLGTVPTYITSEILTEKPGGGAWSIFDVNSAEYGVR